ncbi:MAG: glutamate racemase [Parcubacteria group bacterium]|nr:MAG: glutamate racemase [Parcubacteria group bacterium]
MIGIFDSGFGGLTIFGDIERQLPEYDYIYLGDNARAPYGNHSQELIYEYTRQAVDYLFNQGCDLIILACHTASAEALRKLQQEYLPKNWPGKNVLGVIRPIAEEAIRLSSGKKVAVIGTQSTIDSQSYIREIQHQDPSIAVIQQACPLLVPIIEEGQIQAPSTRQILRDYLESIKEAKPDVLILGCTHYGWLYDIINKLLGGQVQILDSGRIVAEKLADYLARHSDLVKKSLAEPQRIFLTTDDNKKFDRAAQKWLGREIKSQIIKLT